MIQAAGILFLAPNKRALFLLRGRGGDFPLQWCLPGGKREADETIETCAEREAIEEIGALPEGLRTYLARSQAISSGIAPDGEVGLPGQAAAGEQVDFTTFAQRVEGEFAPQVEGEHIGWAWCPISDPPQPLHPGVAIVLRRIGMNETQVARMIAAGELTSPQRFENMALYAMRMSGTGVSYRQGIDEFVWRDPAIWLSQDMIDRCAGTPLIWEHPPTSVLNSREFASRVVGAVMFGYIKNEELWCIVRVYDEEAIKLMEEDRLSTSPAVVFRDPDANSKMKLEDGSALLVEGVPSYLDHLAICGLREDGTGIPGVWDKGAGLNGIAQEDLKTDSQSDPAPQRHAKIDSAKLDAALCDAAIMSVRLSSIASIRRR
jgi:8-oxo-dGTP pyrophosphatase MutT (NUDIX family)